MKLSIVLSTQPPNSRLPPSKATWRRTCVRIAALGYDGVELAIRDPKLVDLTMLEQLARQVQAVRSGHRHRPGLGRGRAVVHRSRPVGPASAIERIKSHIPVAARFGAVIIIGLIRGIVKPGVDQDRRWTGWSKPCASAAQAPTAWGPPGAGTDQPLRDDADQHYCPGAGVDRAGRRG